MKTRNIFNLLLVAVLLLMISCSGRDDASRKGAMLLDPSLSQTSRELLTLLPDDNAVPGWTMDSDARFFVPDDLWELINGAADGYLTYGFQEVVTAEYGNPQMPSPAMIDIYRMKDERNAFGIYTSELNPYADFIEIGVEGYIGGTALNFWAGPYYVKIAVFQEGEEMERQMRLFAERISENIGDPGSVPREIALFPEEDRIPHSFRYLPKDVLGQAYLEEGFEARYRKGDSETRLVIITSDNSETAAGNLSRYRDFTASGGEVSRTVTAPGDGGFTGRDAYYGNMAALRDGNRIVIALGGPSVDSALSLAESSLGHQ
jgi:hypothetical protein